MIKSTLSKFTFVLSKCDLITPVPYICAKHAKKHNKSFFVPQSKIRNILDRKCEYIQEYFLRPFAKNIVSSTFNDGDFEIKDDRFVYDENQITFNGLLDSVALAKLKQKHPKHVKVFDRLGDNHKIIPCSSYYRFNLYQVINVVINKLGLEAITRFQNFFQDSSLEMLDFDRALHFRNFLIMDVSKNKIIFDLANHSFET
jgi:hypothetical protein